MSEFDVPDMASTITSEFTATSIRLIAELERALELTLVHGQAILMVQHGLAATEARNLFMARTAGAPEIWVDLQNRKMVYDNLLQVMTEEVQKWQKEHPSDN
jgi:hypothetical protein